MRLLVIGAGGHASVVVDAAQLAGIDVVRVVGDPGGRSDVLGVPVSPSAKGADADGFIVAVGDNLTRAGLFADYSASGLRPATVIHPSAVIAPGVVIGEGTFVAAGVVINTGAHIGSNAILNTSSTVDHDCVIGDHAHIGPMTGLCGGVSIGEGALVGAGCSIIPSRSVGNWTVLGAGTVVVGDIPADGRYAGVPARSITASEE
ncbi:MAG: acetyltransferase [Coriobacteriia bacterium]|nr:acetyltransferase [Coriobacteriia bacterium]